MVKNQEVWGMVFYFVQRGETLFAIAKRYQTTVHAIVSANRLEDPNAICPGQALIIPRPGEVPSPPPGGIVHLVRPGETIFHLATKFRTTAHDILRANQIAHPEFILAGQQLVIPERMESGDDWPMFGRTPGRTGAGPVLLRGTPSEGWTYAPRKNAGALPSAPVVRYDRVFIGLGDSHFYSLDRTTGRVKWRVLAGGPKAVALIGEHPLATPAVFDGLAYLAGPDGTLYAVDAYHGQPIWKIGLGAPVTSSPAVYDGVVYLGTWDEHVYALEAKTGAVAWRKHVGAPVTLPVAVGDEHVFIVTDAGNLWALDGQTGDTCWELSIPLQQAPVFAEVLLLVGGRAYDPKTGQVVWEVDAGNALPVARVDQVIYPSGAVDLFAGTLCWANVAGRPALTAYSGDPAGETVAPGSETGGEQPTKTVIPPPDIPLRSHITTGSLLIGVCADGHLCAWNVANGQNLWQIALSGRSHQPPAIAPGQIFLAMEDGTVRSFRVPVSKQND
jgi:outer membrane protein assembly factor BamB